METQVAGEAKESARRLERAEWRACRATVVAGAALVLAVLALAGVRAGVAEASDPEILRVRGLVVVDENGTERVWIGAPVPEPLSLGKRLNRGGSMAGILLFDQEGNERSGYVTSDGYPNVLFTLDSVASQQVLFIAEPQGDTALSLWAGDNRLDLHVGEDGAGIDVVRGGEKVFTLDEDSTDEHSRERDR